MYYRTDDEFAISHIQGSIISQPQVQIYTQQGKSTKNKDTYER